MKIPLLNVFLALILGFAGGWMLKPRAEVTGDDSTAAAPHGPALNLQRGKAEPGGDAASVSDGSLASEPVTTADALLGLFGYDHSVATQAAAYQRLRSLSATQLEALGEALIGVPQSSRRQQARTVLFTRWAEIDPEALWAYALRSKDRWIRDQGILEATKSLAQRDLSRARDLLSTVKERNVREQAISVIAMEWVERDAGAALEWAAKMPGNRERTRALRAVAQRMGTLGDPQNAMTLLSGMKLSQADETMAIAALATTAFSSDPEAALSWMETLTAKQRVDILANNLHQLVRYDPKRAKEFFTANLNGRVRHSVSYLAEHFALDDLPAAQAWVEELQSGEVRHRAMQGVVNAMAKNDPQAAAAFMEAQGISGSNRHIAEGLVIRWTQQDREGAMAWIDTQSDRELRLQLRDSLVEAWADEDPEAASVYAQGIEDPGGRRSALRHAVGPWAERDTDAALSFVNGLDPAEQTPLMTYLIGRLAYQDVNTAVKLFEEHLPNITDDSQMRSFATTARRIADDWADWDAKGAGEWALSIQNESAQVEAVQSVANEWARYDTMGASEWIGQLPVGAARDGAVTSLIGRIRLVDPSAAFAWANSISDENKRQESVRNVLNDWKRVDRNAAFNALQSANVSDEAFQSLSRQFDN